MILLRLQGGLGNQMFQYAFAKACSLRLKQPLKLDLSLLGEKAEPTTVVRHFDLDIFQITESFALMDEIEYFNGKESPNLLERFTYKIRRIQNPNLLVVQQGNSFEQEYINKVKADSCIVGRWQSEKYFESYKGEIKEIFNPSKLTPNHYSIQLLESLDNSVKIGVQVRRGDYVTHPVYSKTIGALSKAYYEEAIKYLKEKLKTELKFIFISDDIAWCKSNFKEIEGSIFVEQEKNKQGYLSDLWLLSQMNHNIISNSTFSWWGAWMGENENSMIVVPKFWTRSKELSNGDIVPSRWVTLKNNLELLS
jgi:hypothetical protein